jgi:hypothetical protein
MAAYLKLESSVEPLCVQVNPDAPGALIVTEVSAPQKRTMTSNLSKVVRVALIELLVQDVQPLLALPSRERMLEVGLGAVVWVSTVRQGEVHPVTGALRSS